MPTDPPTRIVSCSCFFCWPCYSDEMRLFSSAVKRRPERLTLYYSPGGGALVVDGHWAAAEQIASFYRTITDFDGGDYYDWGGLQQAIFIAGNFSAAGIVGANGTWPDAGTTYLTRYRQVPPSDPLTDQPISWRHKMATRMPLTPPPPPRPPLQLDMMPMDANWWPSSGDPGAVEKRDRGQTIATLWMMGRRPLFTAGLLPLDATTTAYLTNPLALALNRRAEAAAGATSVAYEGNCTCSGGEGSCTIPHGAGDHPAQPCVARWAAPVLPAGWVGCALINMGEDAANVSTGFAQLGLPAQPEDRYRVVDIWSGAQLGDFAGDATFATSLRPHASALLQVSRLSREAQTGVSHY